MFKLTSLVALASLAVAAPAQAQTIPASAITVTIPHGSPCKVTPLNITLGKTGNELRFAFQNDGTNPISFTLRLTVIGTTPGGTLTRTLPDAARGGRLLGANLVEVGGMTTSLSDLANPRATAELLNCVNQPLNRPLAFM